MPKRKAADLESSKNLSYTNVDQSGNATPSPSKRRRKTDEELIDEVNDLRIEEFKAQHIAEENLVYSTRDITSIVDVHLTLKSSADLTKDELNTCFQLIESTSRPDYESSSWGWHPKRKKREMKEDEMRYLLVRPTNTNDQSGKDSSNHVQGFLSFMLTHDSTPSAPVLYIYEIHLAQALRKVGLGAHLMHVAESIAESVGVEKVVLTCFLSNERAHRFYRNRGYAADACSPEDRRTRKKVVKADHVIMSKAVGVGLEGCGLEVSGDDDVRHSVSENENVRMETAADDVLEGIEGYSFLKRSGGETRKGANMLCNNAVSVPEKAWHALFHNSRGTTNKENDFARVAQGS